MVDNNDKIICRCEDITESQVMEAIEKGATTADEVKRLTRAGMGHCQGRTCRRLVNQILARQLGQTPEDQKAVTQRSPLQPISLKILADS
ncbi:MAG: (2Fe-2S)-binding protein [Candidatus Edwardsbacteria bacterium RIFOXYD12_FULL_50_11]|uniref:(2Fe-2S)-binding protein n=1 Tax=Candidatus Edwardsbacteria bacterium GWF2_54_11 TaxID=1817851 RepID=A0A1F5RIZ5_9BACT|nr:MAG: (2Fe-2S)-binding protein [Candidatus Edwardsbacteria bacterium RifOxyC12_full_54_24]OGF08703.1 MAG: (2Fe-2S)-binding protein [Candidatus Edwardsbacteria bacterium RifOxyA12_full_54_48]OGF12296.1 MAG: (2Fe-2S)-binding protein [Candidatus Edwardsbacteria bacterium GWE2_54_12]OGF14359.1 MAG: (2Fe-2S)-binding protein [Candidatus Edwardsbacteria bacterium GWF2_54_11]OGF15797.1 MAG: (2Fe-2S)-binding protein [Candidatus Edwardsbacteria bacterium RIFOXYD12_FULL_50_11]OGJ18160.1 MAG: (2Fe-2S)-b